MGPNAHPKGKETTMFEFDDFDSQVNCEEYYSETEPTDKELQEMMADGEWEAIPMHPYDDEGFDSLELETIFRGLGFDVINVETIYE